MQSDDRGTGDKLIFDLGEATLRYLPQRSGLPRTAEYMAEWRRRYLEHMKPMNRYTTEYSYREGVMMKTCVICRRTMVLYNFYSFEQGVGDTTSRICRRCRLMYTQEWPELRLKRRKSNMHPEMLTETNLGMIKPELVDLGYDKSHQNRDHEKKEHPSPAIELAATLRNIPQAPQNGEKVLSWISSVTSPDSGTSAAPERLLPSIASIVGDIPSVLRPSTIPHPGTSKGAFTDTVNVLPDRSLGYYWYARERAQQKLRAGMSRTRGANTSLPTGPPKNEKVKELEGDVAFSDRDQSDHGRNSQKWPGYGETHGIDSPTGFLLEQHSGRVPVASYSVPSDIRPQLRKREGHEYLQTTPRDTASARQTNNLDQGLLALGVAAGLPIPTIGKLGKHFYESKEGVRIPSSWEDVPPECPIGKNTKITLELPTVCSKPRLAVPSVEQLDTMDGIDMSAIAKMTG